jgi:hypothetical protein
MPNIDPEDEARGASNVETVEQDESMMEFETQTGELKTEQVQELICQALETEIGGVQIYRTALRCAQNEELKEEWTKYLEETENHERILREVCDKIGVDPDTDTPGRRVVKHNGEGLVAAMEMALNEGEPAAAQIVAAECVVLAETKDHFNWQLIGEISGKCEGELKNALEEAYEEVEDQEDEHLYHTKGWARELWFESFGLPAQFPPVEEKKKVTTQIGAARAQKQRSRTVARAGNRQATPRRSSGRKAVGRGGKTNPKTKAGSQRNKARARTRGRNG